MSAVRTLSDAQFAAHMKRKREPQQAASSKHVLRVVDRRDKECPWCGSTDIDAEFVDVGVGSTGMQVTPWMCGDCGAQQIGAMNKEQGDAEERKRGWFRGYPTE